LKILFVNDYGFPRGGAETLVDHERSELEARGHRTGLLSLDSPRLYGPAEAWVHPFEDPASRVGSLWHQLRHGRARRALELAVRETHPDLIHYHTLTRLGPGVMAGGASMPAVVTLHDYALLYPRLRSVAPDQPFCNVGEFACCPRHAGLPRYAFERLRTAIHRRLLNRAQWVLVPSEYMRRVVSACGVKRVRVCANGVPTQSSAADGAVRPPRILYAGRLEREKGVFELVAAFELLADRNDSVELRVAGSGAELAPLGERIQRSRHAARISLLGTLPASELREAYTTARVVALPSLWPEPFGLTGIEAMGAGTPVVGSGRGGMTEWLRDGVNGVCADPTDAAAFSSALESVTTDDGLFARLASGGRDTAGHFTLERHVDCLESVYAQAAR
jgi:glycosyltransferase involved in cell wall biosynthesis